MSGGIIGKTRIFQPFLLVGGLLATVGAALLYTVDLDSSKARYLGPQVIFGFGIGLGCQVPMMALQSFTPPEDVASVTSIIVSKYPRTNPISSVVVLNQMPSDEFP